MSSRSFLSLVTVSSILAAGIGMTSSATAADAAARSVSTDATRAMQARVATQNSASASRDAFMQVLATHSASGTGGVQPSEIFKNIDRAYPPSCLGSPMQLGLYFNDPHKIAAQVTLYGDPLGSAAEKAFHETDTVTVFRVPCSGGKSATLIEIDRPAGHDTTLYPVFPNVFAGPPGGAASADFAVRLSNDPNTFYATVYSYSPLVNSDVFVVENFYNPSVAVATQTHDFNQSFVLYVDNQSGIPNDPNAVTSFTLPAYNAADYPAAALLPISGYMSTNWTSPTQGGEGIIMQVYDNGDNLSRTLAFAWFTYDANKRPFWLFGETSLTIGTTTISAPTVYFNNGTFGGTSSVGLPATQVGFVTFKFPDCGHMNVAYNIDASAFQGPKGQGSANYARVADVNGLVCQ